MVNNCRNLLTPADDHDEICSSVCSSLTWFFTASAPVCLLKVCCVVCLQLGVVDSPPRVFNSPYASIDYNAMYRVSGDNKVCGPFFIFLYLSICSSSLTNETKHHSFFICLPLSLTLTLILSLFWFREVFLLPPRSWTSTVAAPVQFLAFRPPTSSTLGPASPPTTPWWRGGPRSTRRCGSPASHGAPPDISAS